MTSENRIGWFLMNCSAEKITICDVTEVSLDSSQMTVLDILTTPNEEDPACCFQSKLDI